MPGRHLVLTLWGLFLPGLLLVAGIYLCINGFSDCWGIFSIWRNAWRRNRRRTLEKKLDPVFTIAAQTVVNTMTHSTPPLIIDWFYTVSGAKPCDVSIWFVFQADTDFEQVVASGLAANIERQMRDELRRCHCPADVIEQVFIGFKTHESIRRQLGNHYVEQLQIQMTERP